MIPGSANPLLLKSAAAAGPVQIERSLRFNSSDSAYLSRTPASAGNRKTWTWAGWVKRSALGSNQALMTVEGNSDSTTAQFWFSSDDKFRFGIETADIFVTNAVFRDCSAWYHIVFAFDATNATSADRMILYINGVRQTTSTYTAPSNTDYGFNRASAIHAIGRRQNVSDWYLNGYLADVHFIDGQALTPSSFTEVSATTGQLIPKAYTGSYTGNSFWLKFSDNSAATATTLGKDSFLLGNNWTPNNLSVTAGAGNDSLVDTPTSYGTDTGAGGEVRGNYATWNPLDKNASFNAANGNLDANASAGVNGNIRGTIGVSSGKWYWEYLINNTSPAVGIAAAAATLADFPGVDASGYSYTSGGQKWNSNSGSSYGATYTTNDIIGVALDLDAGTLVFYKNGVSQGTAYSGLPVGTYFPAGGRFSGTFDVTLNAGARPFAYTAPSGFKALCDTNLTSTTITTSGSYTGNGTADGPFVYLNGVPTAMTIGGNAVTFGTHADKLSNGFKIRTSSTTYNQNASSYSYSITSTGAAFKNARAQPNP